MRPELNAPRRVICGVEGMAVFALLFGTLLLVGIASVIWWHEVMVQQTVVCPECEGIGTFLTVKDPHCGGDGKLTKWESWHE